MHHLINSQTIDDYTLLKRMRLECVESIECPSDSLSVSMQCLDENPLSVRLRPGLGQPHGVCLLDTKLKRRTSGQTPQVKTAGLEKPSLRIHSLAESLTKGLAVSSSIWGEKHPSPPPEAPVEMGGMGVKYLPSAATVSPLWCHDLRWFP